MKRIKDFVVMLFLSMIVVPTALAQLDFTVDTVLTDNFPIIEVNVETRFSGIITRSLDSSHFRLIEDGFEQMPLKYTCPQPSKSFSLTIIIAMGSSMTASDVSFAKGVANGIVARMNGLTDEVAIYVYNDNAFLQQEFTAIKPLLAQRIDAISPTSGGNHIWDGTYGGLAYCANDGIHLSRAVLLLSNGRGDGGSKSLGEVIALAKATKIPVHCLGINAVNSDQEMKDLSAQTGGIYYSNAAQTIQELVDLLNGTPPYCTLEYTSNNLCRDGVDRSIHVRLRKDNDSVNTTHQFALSSDAGSNVAVTLKVDTATITSGITQDVAMLLSPALQDQRLYDGWIEVHFDTSKLKLQNVRTTGFLAEGVAATVSARATGARITLAGTARLNGSGTLMMLEFVGGTVQAQTVVAVSMSGLEPDLTRGCLNATFGTANINVVPKRVSISTKAQPIIFNWDNVNNHYTPDPGILTVEVTNDGDLSVTNLSATMARTPEIRMAFGGSATVTVVPSTLEPGKKGAAIFSLQALPQRSETTAQTDVVVTSNEGATATQRVFLNIKPAESAFSMSCDADKITIDAGTYTPDPAEVRATITSTGTMDSPTGEVKIELPTGLTLAGGSDTQQFAALASGNTQVLTWPVKYSTPAVKTDYEILLIASASGYRNDTCRVTLTVPVLKAAELIQRCQFEPAVADSTTGFDPLTVSTWVHNTGNEDAANVTASIVSTPDFNLGNGETPSKSVAAVMVGDSVRFAWVIHRVAAMSCGPTQLDIDMIVTADNADPSTCTAIGMLNYPLNLLPEITGAVPAVLDTTDKDLEVHFEIQMFDFERGELTYRWLVNGTEEGENASDFAWTFAAVGAAEVKVEIYDPCSLAANDAVTHVWNFFVRDPTGIEADPAALRDFAILGNYPNPFNPGTVIEYRIPEGRHDMRLEVLDANGRVLRLLTTGERSGGVYRATFDASDLPSGTYVARLTTGGVVRVHRMVLVK